MAKPRKEKGFILITVLFLLLLVAVTAMSLNVKSGMQVEMAANQTADAQTYLDQLAVIEESVWQLARDPFWRPTQLSTSYHGKQYNRTVTKSPMYSDTIVISVQAPTASRTVNTSFRYHINTVAGTGVGGYNGEGLATDARLNSPSGVAAYYNTSQMRLFLYVADRDNNRVRRIDTTTGVINTIAGTGISGFDGDGTDWFSATSKRQLNKPQGVFVDGNGDVYIADTANHRIRRVTTVEPIPGFYWTTIDTIAGTGVATDPPGSPVDYIRAVNTTLNSPAGVCVDASGNVYIADTLNNSIRKVAAYTGIITTVAGGGTGVGETNPDPTKMQLSSPSGVFVDTERNIYIADTGKHKIRKVTVATGIISTVAGISGSYSGPYPPLGDGGAATAAQLSSPKGVTVDSARNVYIADTGNHRLRIVSNPSAAIDPGVITTLAGTSGSYSGPYPPVGDGGAATAAGLSSPGGVALGQQKGGGRIYIGDTGNNRVRMLRLKTEPRVYGP